jgi:hypothetical protein
MILQKQVLTCLAAIMMTGTATAFNPKVMTAEETKLNNLLLSQRHNVDGESLDESLTLALDTSNAWKVGTSTRSTAKYVSSRRVTANDVVGFYIDTDTVSTGTSYRIRSSKITADTSEDGDVLVNQLYGIQLTNCHAYVSGNTFKIPAAEVVDVSTTSGGTVKGVICPVDLEASTVNTKGAIEGTILDDGTIVLPSWGIFVVTSSGVTQVSNVIKTSILRKCNASVTAKVYNTDNTSEWGVVVKQTYKNRIEIENFSNTGASVEADLDHNKVVEVTPHYMGSSTQYGELDCMPMNTSSAGEVQPMVFSMSSDGLTATTGSWGVFAVSSTGTALYRYDNMNITFSSAFSFPETLTANFSGSGTESAPYELKTEQDIRTLAQIVNDGADQKGVYYKLANDIDCQNSEYIYTPIGKVAKGDDVAHTNTYPDGYKFNGNIDGNGYSIKNITYTTSGRRGYVGFISYLGEDGAVKDLNVKSCRLLTYGAGVGSVAALSYGKISNCKTTDNQLLTAAFHAGGIAAVSRGSVSNCYADNTLYVYGNAGGIVGFTSGPVHNCVSSGLLTIAGISSNIFFTGGGIAGWVNNAWSTNGYTAEVDSCATGIVIRDYSISGKVGGITGAVTGNTKTGAGQVKRSMSIATISSAACTDEDGSNGCAAAIAANLYNGQIKDCCTAGLIYVPNTPKGTGIVGYILASNLNKVENVYSATQIYVPSSATDAKIALTGYMSEQFMSYFSNVYYDKQMMGFNFTDYGYKGALTTAQMTTADGLSGLDADTWTFTEGLYPRLKCMENQSYMQLLAAPFYLTDNQTVRKVMSNYTASTANDISWGVLTEDGMTDEGAGLTVDGGNVKVSDAYTDNYFCGYKSNTPYFKEYLVKTQPFSLFDGSGTAEDPYQVKTVEDLININEGIVTYSNTYENVYFKVMNDIDVARNPQFTGIAADGNTAHEFYGTFDGDNHVIDNIYLSKVGYDEDGKGISSGSTSYCGLFGRLNSKGVIKNVILGPGTDMTFWMYSGGIVGNAAGRVENCVNMGTISSVSSSVGGIAGYVVKTTGEVAGCRNLGKVTGGLLYAGGIAGQCFGTIENCENDGYVASDSINAYNTVAKARYAGGIVGYASAAKINNCVNNGQVVGGSQYVGGIIGGLVPLNSSVNNCINNGIVSAPAGEAMGAIIGYLTTTANYEATNNFYDNQIVPNGAVNYENPDGFTGLSTAEMTSGKALGELTSEVFDFKAGLYPVLAAYSETEPSVAMRSMVMTLQDGQTVLDVNGTAKLAQVDGLTWSVLHDSPIYTITPGLLTIGKITDQNIVNDTIVATMNGYSRQFAIRTVPSFFEGNGTESVPYLINNKEDMATLIKQVDDNLASFDGKYFKLTADLDYTDDATFRPVGYDNATFGGIFDGDNHSIKNLVINKLTDASVALFGTVKEGGVIKNLTLEGGKFTTTVAKPIAGFVHSLGGTVENCINRNEIDGSAGNYAAGIAYELKSTAQVTNSKNYGSVSSKTGNCGGIVGTMASGSKVADCENYGEIHSSGTNNAGIAARSASVVENCTNYANISIEKNVLGGIVGYATDTCFVNNCVNKGKIELTATAQKAGGLVGYAASRIHITNSENYGDVSAIGSTSYTYVGGLIGQVAGAGSSIVDCKNYGNVASKAGQYSGGIAGYVDGSSTKGSGTFQRCYNYGNVTGVKNGIAGIIGYCKTYNDLMDCGNYGTISSTSTTANLIGGVCGYGSASTYTRCFNVGDVSGVGYMVSGFVGQGSDFTMTDCFNLGNVTTTGTGNSAANFAAAGMLCYGSGKFYNCYNMGTITAADNVAGFAGYIITSGTVSNCYNAGNVVATAASPENVDAFIAGSKVDITASDNYYDSTVVTAKASLTAATAKTTKELLSMDMGVAYTNVAATYPILTSMKDVAEASFAAAQILFQEDSESETNVCNTMTIGIPENVTWTSSENLTIEGDKVKLPTSGAIGQSATLTKTAGESLSKTYNLVINALSGVDSIHSDSDIVLRTYYNLSGIEIAAPQQGEVVIEKTLYRDGTTTVRKIAVR